jgi:hypothetical protein
MIMASHPGRGPQSAGVLLSPNSLDPRHPHIPPQKKRKVQPMCPVRNVVNYVSGRSTIIDALVPRLKRSDQPPQDPFR